MKLYKEWLAKAPKEIKEQLKEIPAEELADRFGSDISFGTAGMRGPMKLGSAYINEFTIAKAAFAYGKVLKEKYGRDATTNGIVIAHDNRKNKLVYSMLAAEILSAMNIPVYLFQNNKLQPTPLLSYTIGSENYVGGINITASHNPATDNGFKVYDEEGKQMDAVDTNKIQKYMKEIANPFKIPRNNKKVSFLSKTAVNRYVIQLLRQIPFHHNVSHKKLKVVFSPQHGTSLKIATRIMDQMKVKYTLVKEQAKEDPNFTHTLSPNPQDPRSFDLAKKYGDKSKADILFSTDPDADRFGIVVKHKGKWVHMDGNQLPVVQLYWKLKNLREIDYLRKGDFIVRSVVTSNFGDKIAKYFGVNTHESLTGFKHIINTCFKYEKKGYESIFAYEESYGSTIKTFTRDKDAFQALIQVIEIASELKASGKTLIDLYNELQRKFGYHMSEQKMIRFDGPTGIKQANKLIEKYKNVKVGSRLAGLKVTEVRDFSKGYKKLPKDNFVTIVMGESSISIRPSGTEPLLRIYCYGFGKTSAVAKKNLKNILNIIK